jgi:hypothetical protein
MTGAEYLDLLCGTTSQIGMLDCNVDDTEYRALVLQWANLVLQDIANRQTDWHYDFLEVTATAPSVSGQLDYDLPADIDGYKIFSVLDRTHNNTYRFCPHDKFLRFVPNPSLSEGSPYWYTVWADSLKLWPVPNSVFTIYLKYIKTMTELGDNTTACVVPDKYKTVIIDGILMWAYKFDPKMGSSSEQARIYEYGAGGNTGNIKGGVQQMLLDQKTNINELGQTESHRTNRRRMLSPYRVSD